MIALSNKKFGPRSHLKHYKYKIKQKLGEGEESETKGRVSDEKSGQRDKPRTD